MAAVTVGAVVVLPSFQLPLDAFPPGWLQQAGLALSMPGDNGLIGTPLLLPLPLTQLEG